MKKVKVILPIILPILLIMGILAVSVYADPPESPPGQSKPKPKQEPILISVTGDIEGTGNPANIAIKFSETFQGIDVYGNDRDESGSFIANPDNPPALKITGPGRHRRLKYYYCDADTHPSETDICGVTGHDPDNYKCLTIIYEGRVEKKTERVVFPAGSRWVISWKKIMGTILEGTLAEDVTYEVLQWSE